MTNPFKGGNLGNNAGAQHGNNKDAQQDNSDNIQLDGADTSDEQVDNVQLNAAESAETEKLDTEGAVEEQTAPTELDKVKADFEQLNNQYLRLAADFENYRKRQEQERENLIRYGAVDTLKKLLEVLDNFDRGKAALENVEDCKVMKDNFDLLHKQVMDVLAKLGLEVIEAEGKEFDPNFHEAVMQTPTSEHPEHTVIKELQKGYKLGDKVLRPSLVNVAVAE